MGLLSPRSKVLILHGPSDVARLRDNRMVERDECVTEGTRVRGVPPPVPPQRPDLDRR